MFSFADRIRSSFLLVIIFCICSFSVFSQESDEKEEKSDKEEIQSLVEERTDTLRYGIDSEVISLLEKLIDEKEDNLSDIIAEIYAETSNNAVMEKAVDYFIAVDYSSAVVYAEKRIEKWEDEDIDVITSSLRYISKYPGDSTEELIMPLVEHDSKTLASSALSALGKCGTDTSADYLLDLLEDDDYDEDLKPTIIKSLGAMKSEMAVDILIEILEDIDEEKSWRWTACEALGDIGHPDALDSIRQALNDDDTYLRSYAVKALRNFDGVDEVLMQSLKDSFWRVRVSAAEALGERSSKDAVDILIYKAKKDPENNVKIAAVEALGKIGDKESLEFLRELYEKNTTPQAIRTKAAEIIIEKDLKNSIDIITKVLAEEWEKDSSPVLSYTCKFLSTAEESRLEPIFERMLGHNDVAIKIYGIRGIKNNGFSSMKEKIEKLSEEGNNNAVRRAALSAVEEL